MGSGIVQNKNLHLVDFISYCTPHNGMRIEITILGGMTRMAVNWTPYEECDLNTYRKETKGEMTQKELILVSEELLNNNWNNTLSHLALVSVAMLFVMVGLIAIENEMVQIICYGIFILYIAALGALSVATCLPFSMEWAVKTDKSVYLLEQEDVVITVDSERYDILRNNGDGTVLIDKLSDGEKRVLEESLKYASDVKSTMLLLFISCLLWFFGIFLLVADRYKEGLRNILVILSMVVLCSSLFGNFIVCECLSNLPFSQH